MIPACDQSWRMFHMQLRRMYILLLFSGMLYKYQLTLSVLTSSVLDDLSIDQSEVLKSPTIIVLLSIFLFIIVSICLIY